MRIRRAGAGSTTALPIAAALAGGCSKNEFNVDKAPPQFTVGFNQVWNDAKTFTPKDTAIPTPNADTPYAMVRADRRAEPLAR